MTTTAQERLAATVAQWDAELAAIQKFRAIDRIQNEGGEGYSHFESQSERLAERYLPLVTALQAEAFDEEWTAEVTADRRAAWNAEMKKAIDAGRKLSFADVREIQSRLGFELGDLKRAIILRGL